MAEDAMENKLVRGTREVIDDHLRRAKLGDLEGDLRENYARDVVFVAVEATYRGHDGIRAAAKFLEDRLPGHDYEYVTVKCEGEIAFLVWKGRGGGLQVQNGVDTFVVRDGKIVAQTAAFEVTSESTPAGRISATAYDAPPLQMAGETR
jgi:hypothetical protein